MPAIELYNHTSVMDEALEQALKYAKRRAEVKGDVAVKALKMGGQGSWGTMFSEVPTMGDLIGRAKRKFKDRGYKHPDYLHVKSPTKNREFGWVRIRVRLIPSYINEERIQQEAEYRAKGMLQTMLHEMRHVWQYRGGRKITSEFKGYGPNSMGYKRTKHQKRPIEQDVNDFMREQKPETAYEKNRYDTVVEILADALIDEFYTRKIKKAQPKAKKDLNYVDYTNARRVPENHTLEVCPYCGRKSAAYDGFSRKTYIHKRYWIDRYWEDSVIIEGCMFDKEGNFEGEYIDNKKDTDPNSYMYPGARWRYYFHDETFVKKEEVNA